MPPQLPASSSTELGKAMRNPDPLPAPPPLPVGAQNKWTDVEFTCMPYKEVKDVFILGGIEDVQVRPSGPWGQPRAHLA